MLIEVYTCGRSAASFAPRPGYRRRWLVVPGGSELQDTKVYGRTHTFLFCPTADPCQMSAWSARGAVNDARRNHSRFRLIPSHETSTRS